MRTIFTTAQAAKVCGVSPRTVNITEEHREGLIGAIDRMAEQFEPVAPDERTDAHRQAK